MLTIYCYVWGLPLRVDYIPSETPLEKNILSFASDYSLEINSDLGTGTCAPSPLSTGTLSGAEPCKSCACCHSLSELICALDVLCLEGLLSLISSIPSGSCTLSPSLGPAGRDLMEISHLLYKEASPMMAEQDINL